MSGIFYLDTVYKNNIVTNISGRLVKGRRSFSFAVTRSGINNPVQ